MVRGTSILVLRYVSPLVFCLLSPPSPHAGRTSEGQEGHSMPLQATCLATTTHLVAQAAREQRGSGLGLVRCGKPIALGRYRGFFC
ncbi:hypothetical protein BGZ63DRAFT_396613 [Mariannaea sp. PMI_226]|nr:hypothetical protein BGZ63DRAFT_396613 [Mariannaea sp. PMI_226]